MHTRTHTQTHTPNTYSIYLVPSLEGPRGIATASAKGSNLGSWWSSCSALELQMGLLRRPRNLDPEQCAEEDMLKAGVNRFRCSVDKKKWSRRYVLYLQAENACIYDNCITYCNQGRTQDPGNVFETNQSKLSRVLNFKSNRILCRLTVKCLLTGTLLLRVRIAEFTRCNFKTW